MDDATQKLVDEARRAQAAVYLATDKAVADDLSRIIAGLADALEAAQRPPVSPEVREEIAAVLFDADEHHDGTEAEFRNEAHTIGGGHHRASARAQAAALLARFSVPSQPVYDEEKIAQIVDQQMRRAGLSDNPAEFDSSIHSWRCEHPNIYGACECFQDMRSELVAALVAALRGGELTREETNE